MRGATVTKIAVICRHCEANGYPRLQGVYPTWELAESRIDQHLFKVGPVHEAEAFDNASHPHLVTKGEIAPYARGLR